MTVVGSDQDQGIFFFFFAQGGLDGMNCLEKAMVSESVRKALPAW